MLYAEGFFVLVERGPLEGEKGETAFPITLSGLRSANGSCPCNLSGQGVLWGSYFTIAILANNSH